MGFRPPFDCKKVLLLPYLPSEFSNEAEIMYIYVIGVLDVPFGGFDFSDPYHPLTAPKKWFLIVFTHFLSLFLAQLLLKLGEELEIRYSYLVGAFDVPFGGLDFSSPFHPLASRGEK